GAVVVGVSAAAPVASVETKATLVGVGEVEPELALDPAAVVTVTRLTAENQGNDMVALVAVALTATAPTGTEAVLYVNLPEGLSFETILPSTAAPNDPLCRAADPGEADGACAVTLVLYAGTASFLVRGRN